MKKNVDALDMPILCTLYSTQGKENEWEALQQQRAGHEEGGNAVYVREDKSVGYFDTDRVHVEIRRLMPVLGPNMTDPRYN